jgi:uncharacterized protein YicC (UPF0701 family)
MMSQAREISRLTKDLGQAAKLRKAATDAMRLATKSMLASCATARGELGREYAAETRKFLASLGKDVAAFRRAMAHQIAKTRKDIAAMKKNVAAGRQAAMGQVTRWTSARSKASNLLHRDLERQAASIMSKTAQLRSEFANVHRNMAKQQEAALKSGHRKLHDGMARVVNVMHADRMKAHGILANFRLSGAA